MAIRDIDALRVVADPTYAATLTAEEWESLSLNADWMHLTTEYSEVVDQAVGSIRPTMAQIAQAQWAPIGVKVKIQLMEFAAWVQRWLAGTITIVPANNSGAQPRHAQTIQAVIGRPKV